MAPARDDDDHVLLRATLDAAIDPQVYLAAVRDDQGHIVDFVYADANPAAAEYMHMPREELVGASVLGLLPGQAASGMLAMYAEAVESGGPLVLDGYPYLHEIQESERRFDIRGVKVGDGLSFSWRDVTARYEAERQLEASEERFRMLAVNSSDVVMQVNLLGIIQWASPSAKSLLGRDPQDLVGVNTFDLIRSDYKDKFISDLQHLISTGEKSKLRYPCLRPDGTSLWVESVGNLVRDEDDKPLFRVVRLRDINDTHQAEEELEQTRDRLRALTDSLMDPVISVKAVPGDEDGFLDFAVEEANDAACRELRRTRENVIGHSVREVFGRRHAADRVADWCARAYIEREPIAEDDAVMTGDSSEEPWRFDIRAVPFGDSVSFVWRDVTYRYLARQRLAASEEHYRLLAENVADVVMLVRDGQMQWVSPSLTTAVGWKPDQWEGHRFAEFVHRDDVSSVQPALRAGAMRLRVADNVGAFHWVEMNVSPFKDAHGVTSGTLASFRIADAQVEAERELTYQASHDPLTGLLNRDSAYERLSHWLGDHRPDAQLLLAFADVDDLKGVNDEFGHLVGDRLLEELAKRTKSFLRADDLVARVGGDELLIVLRGAKDLSDGLMVLERLLLVVNEPFSADSVGPIQPRLSIGLTECAAGEEVQAIIRRADNAMYEAKAAGGNCICVAEKVTSAAQTPSHQSGSASAAD